MQGEGLVPVISAVVVVGITKMRTESSTANDCVSIRERSGLNHLRVQKEMLQVWSALVDKG